MKNHTTHVRGLLLAPALFLFHPQPATHAATLTASDGSGGDRFGWSVSQSGSTGLVGAYQDDFGSTNNVGSAYVFRSLDTATGTVTENVKLTASDGTANDQFGQSVSQSGSIGLVGANFDDFGRGSAYVFRSLDTATGTVTENVKLRASDGAADDQFGQSVSQSGSIGLVGAVGDDFGSTNNVGSAYVFRNLDTATGTVTESAKLKASDGAFFDQFGQSVSQSGSIGLVGANFDDFGSTNDVGSAYVFRNLDTATGTVTENVKLTASDGEAFDFFGASVSQSGSIGLVGASHDDFGSAGNVGSAYVFRNLDTATGTVTENVKLTASDGAASDQFGISVSQSGSIGLVGAHGDAFESTLGAGSAYIFRNLDTATGTVTESVKLRASDGAVNDRFGTSVGLSGDNFIIGAPGAVSAARGKAYTGSVSSVTTLDTGGTNRTISGISFISQDDWIIGQTTDGNQVTLSAGDTATVTNGAKAVYIGQNAGSDSNTLIVSGTLTANLLVLGATNNTGNRVVFNPSGTDAANMSIKGSGSVTKTGAGTLTLGGTNTYTGGTLVSAGGLLGNTLSLQGAITNNATVGFDQTTNGTYAGSMIGTGGLTKAGSGTVTLSASNAHSGGATISAGTLVAGHNNAFGTGAVELKAGTALAQTGLTISNTFIIADTTATNAFVAFFNFGTTSPGSAAATTVSGTGVTFGSVTFGNNNGTNLFLTAVSSSSGYTLASGTNASGSFNALTSVNDGPLDPGTSTFYAVSLTGSADTSYSLTNVQFGSRSSLAGPTTLSLRTSTNNYATSLATNANNRNNTWAAFNLALADGTNAVGSTTTLRLYGSGGTNAVANGGQWRIDDLRISGTAFTNARSGTIGLDGAGAASFVGGVAVSSNATVTLTAGSGGEATFSGAISGGGAVTKTGTGTVTFSGATTNTYTGPTIVSAGTLRLNKAPGVMAIAGTNVTVGGSATLLVSSSNQVADTAAVTLSGGTIQRGDAVSETFGNLNLTADSFLNFGTGAVGTLTFGTYAPSFKLTVNNFLIGNTLRFSSNLSGSITNSSLFAFDNGFVSDWNNITPGIFTITAIPEPSTVVAAGGLALLLAAGAWRRRR